MVSGLQFTDIAYDYYDILVDEAWYVKNSTASHLLDVKKRSYTEGELAAAIEKINEDDQAIYFLDELQSLIDIIPYERSFYYFR